MKRTTLMFVFLACLVIILLIITAFTTVTSANAQLGNTGIPVRCSGAANIGVSYPLTCISADGTPFGNSGYTVPDGHYLLVTDIIYDPLGSSTAYWTGQLAVYNGSIFVSQLSVRTHNQATFGEHFITPYLVLSAGQHLQLEVSSSSTAAYAVYVSGLLTTNVNYLPIITR